MRGRTAAAGVGSAWSNYGIKTDDFAANVTMHAVLGGTTAAIGGGKFANGAATAAFGYLYNELLHSAAEARAIYGKGTVGHHFVPFGSTTDLDISSEARAYWGQQTNGMSLPDSVHLPGHSAYNGSVRAELLDWSAKNNIDLSSMTVDQAKSFEAHVRTGPRPAIARILGRIDRYHSMPSTSRSLYRALSAVGASGLVELFYPSPLRAPQCQLNPNIAGC